MPHPCLTTIQRCLPKSERIFLDAREESRVLESAMEMEKKSSEEALKDALDALGELEVHTKAKILEAESSGKELTALLRS